MLLHEGHWIGCSTTWLHCKRNSSLNNWCGAVEEPIYFQYSLIDMMSVTSFRKTNLELRYSGVIPCKDLYIITAADSNLWYLSLRQPSARNNSSMLES